MRISVITVCKNSSTYIETAIKSVLKQQYDDIEYIVVDGNSTDGTLEILNKYASDIDILISEPDTGIYNAMNKGLASVSGDVVYFLNSDDYLFDEYVIPDIAFEFSRNNNISVLYGNVIMFDKNKKNLVKFNRVSKKYFYKQTICHQALFAKLELFSKVGNFNEQYPIHADTDWIMRSYFLNSTTFKYIDRNISYFSTEGFCGNPAYAEKYKYDRQEISAKYFLEARFKLAIKRTLLRFGVKI